MYIFTLPFALQSTMGLMTPVACLWIAYALFGIDEIGVEIEDPFGEDENDLPFDDIAAGYIQLCTDTLRADCEMRGLALPQSPALMEPQKLQYNTPEQQQQEQPLLLEKISQQQAQQQHRHSTSSAAVFPYRPPHLASAAVASPSAVYPMTTGATFDRHSDNSNRRVPSVPLIVPPSHTAAADGDDVGARQQPDGALALAQRQRRPSQHRVTQKLDTLDVSPRNAIGTTATATATIGGGGGGLSVGSHSGSVSSQLSARSGSSAVGVRRPLLGAASDQRPTARQTPARAALMSTSAAAGAGVSPTMESLLFDAIDDDEEAADGLS